MSRRSACRGPQHRVRTRTRRSSRSNWENCYEFEITGRNGGGEEEEEEFVGRGEAARTDGRTRLLLLDQKYAKGGAEELLEAIKAVLLGNALQSRPSISELVCCLLTLSYNYWHLNDVFPSSSA